MSSALQPPTIKTHELEDTGAHDVAESSDGSEDFVDASEGDQQRSFVRRGDQSPIPVTRVEKVDDDPSYGEVPGTTAYSLRSADAVPDEIEVVPEGTRSRSTSRVSRPSTPGGSQIPKIIAEKIDPDEPSYGDVPGTAAYEMRKADATPDEIVKSPDSAAAPANPFKASPTASIDRSGSGLQGDELDLDDDYDNDDPGGGNDDDEFGDDDNNNDGGDAGFGDDFDDFEEGQEGDVDDDDFGEFDEGFQTSQPQSTPQQPSAPAPPPSTQPTIPIPSFQDLDDLSSVQQTCAPYLRALFPSYPPQTPAELPPPSQQIFLSDRSISLYTQLIAPPPLAPPNWLRSRIRRLFLVSLGVPVDLDEILPASKQKKLVLPSGLLKANDPSAGGEGKSPRPSTSEDKSALGKLKSAHDSSTSLGSNTSASKTKSSSRSKKTSSRESADRPPDFDVAAARRLAQTTQERIDGMDDVELERHVKELEAMGEKGREYLGYWERRVVEAGREKEAFEGVIENLVSFARKSRK